MGRFYNDHGQMNTHYKYSEGTIFYDSVSGFMNLTNQVGFTAEETIKAKIKFEREADSVGIKVQKYNTDNRVFTAKGFMSILLIITKQYSIVELVVTTIMLTQKIALK